MAAQHQHYVPQLLLRGFLSRDPALASKEQVHVFDLESERAFTPPIWKIMGERRFNDFWLDEQNLATVEPATGRIETHITPVIERIRREKRLERSPDEISDLALLMAFQFIRTKKMRLLPERLNKQILTHVERMGLDPKKVQGLEDWDEEALKRAHVRQQVRGLAEYAEIIAEKEFFLMKAPERCSFYLGDHPVVLHNDEPPRGRMGRLGLGAPYIQIYLPISADVMLCAYDKAVLGQLMRNHDGQMRGFQIEALGMIRRGQITASQMKDMLDGLKPLDMTTPLIRAIRSGDAVEIGPEQVQCYNSLQAFQAHRFVVDPDGKFDVAREMISDRKESEAKR
jgi:hypothetical protein